MQKRVECECGWFQQTDDEGKLVTAVQQHAKSVHNMDGVTKEQVLAQAKSRGRPIFAVVSWGAFEDQSC